MDADLERELREVCATRIQATIRRFLTRCRVLRLLRQRFEKILDMYFTSPLFLLLNLRRSSKRRRYFYYDTFTDSSSWLKPSLLRHHDIEKISSPYDETTAATMIQRQFRRILALVRVRGLYWSTVYSGVDETSGYEYFYSSVTGASMWMLPSFMYPKQTTMVDSESSEEESVFFDEGQMLPATSVAGLNPLDEPSIDSSQIILRERKYPRSKAQAIIDEAEDGRLQELDLSGIGMMKLSSRVFDLVHLTSLSLAHNKLEHLPTEIQYLQNLTCLRLNGNRLGSIPVEIEELEKLQIFDASSNRLSTLPGHFFKLSRLKELYLSDNPFTVMPMEVGSLELLKELREWEVSIGCLSQLEVLCVNNCALGEWPKQLERLSRLQILDLSKNSITGIAENIVSNRSLREVNLSTNFLYHFPTGLYTLKLEVLNLSHNRIAHLAAFDENHQYSIRKHLKHLDMSHNEVMELGPQLGLFYRLSTFDASHNRITVIHDSISSLLYLTSLNLSNNLLSSLPYGLRTCSALTHINVSYNRFESFPTILNSLTSLSELDISHNLIATISEDSFQKFPALQWLNLSSNLLSIIPASISVLERIQILDISFNRIQSISDSISMLMALNELSLAGNQIVLLPESLCSLTSLKTLDIQRNFVTSLPLSFPILQNLQRLVCSRNNFTDIPTMVLIQLPHLRHWDFSWNPIRARSTDVSVTDPESSAQSHEMPSIRGELGVVIEQLEEEVRRPMLSSVESINPPLFLNDKLEREWNEEQNRQKLARARDMESLSTYHKALAASFSRSDGDINLTVEGKWSSHLNLGFAVHHLILRIEKIRGELFSQIVYRSNDLGALVYAENLTGSKESHTPLVLDCYGYLGQALLHQSQILGLSIRALEKPLQIASRLDVTQRIGLDYLDLIQDAFTNDLNSQTQSHKTPKPRRMSVQSIQKSFEFLFLETAENVYTDRETGLRGVVVLLNIRSLLLERARLILCAATDILRSRGWDPRSPLFSKGNGTVSEDAKGMKQIAAKVFYTLGRVYQSLGNFDLANEMLNSVVIMYPMWSAPKFEMIRSAIAAGRWNLAMNTIDEICLKDFGCEVSEHFSVLELLPLNKELAVLLLLTQSCQQELSKIRLGQRGLPIMLDAEKHNLPYDTMYGRSKDSALDARRLKLAAENADKRISVEAKNENLLWRSGNLREKALKMAGIAGQAMQ